jgi:hypothetical protein
MLGIPSWILMVAERYSGGEMERSLVKIFSLITYTHSHTRTQHLTPLIIPHTIKPLWKFEVKPLEKYCWKISQGADILYSIKGNMA